MGSQEFSIPALMARIPTEADAYLLLEQLRWNGEPVCPHCGSIAAHYYLKPRTGTEARKTRTGSMSQRRVWKCRDCRKQFSVLTGTIFHRTKIPVRTWLTVIFEMSSSKNGVSAREIERKYDLTGKTAWFMLQRIREAMKREPLAGLLRGTVVADETWIGGNPKNRHKNDPREPVRKYATTDKTPVMAIVHYESREVRSKVVPNVNGSTLLPVLREQTDLSTVELWTDGAKAYLTAAPHVVDHKSVDHAAGEYVRDGAGTNLAEGFFSQLKRSLDGTHHPRERRAPAPLPRAVRLHVLDLPDGR
jgi:transposase-like protein